MRRHDVTRSRAHRAAPLPLSTSHDSCVTRVPARPRLPLLTSHDSCVTCSWITTRGQKGLVPRFKPTSHRWVDRSRERRSRRRATARASVFSATRRGEGVRVTLCRDIATRESEGSARAMGAFEGVDSGARAVSTRGDAMRCARGARAGARRGRWTTPSQTSGATKDGDEEHFCSFIHSFIRHGGGG